MNSPTHGILIPHTRVASRGTASSALVTDQIHAVAPTRSAPSQSLVPQSFWLVVSRSPPIEFVRVRALELRAHAPCASEPQPQSQWVEHLSAAATHLIVCERKSVAPHTFDALNRAAPNAALRVTPEPVDTALVFGDALLLLYDTSKHKLVPLSLDAWLLACASTQAARDAAAASCVSGMLAGRVDEAGRKRKRPTAHQRAVAVASALTASASASASKLQATSRSRSTGTGKGKAKATTKAKAKAKAKARPQRRLHSKSRSNDDDALALDDDDDDDDDADDNADEGDGDGGAEDGEEHDAAGDEDEEGGVDEADEEDDPENDDDEDADADTDVDGASNVSDADGDADADEDSDDDKSSRTSAGTQNTTATNATAATNATNATAVETKAWSTTENAAIRIRRKR